MNDAVVSPEGFDAGMALAAVLAGDAGGVAASAGLAPALAARLAARLAPLETGSRTERAAAIAREGRFLRPVPAPRPDEPRRVLSVLAPDAERAQGEVWLASVPGHRAGWSAPADLRALLVRHASARPDRAAREIAELEAVTWPA